AHQRPAVGPGQPRAHHRRARGGPHQRPGAAGAGADRGDPRRHPGRRGAGGPAGAAGHGVLLAQPRGGRRGGGALMAWQTMYSQLLEERVVFTRLPSGLEVFVMPRPGFQKRYAVFSARYGSIDNRFRRPGTGQELEVPDGIAHFLEHQLFEDEEGHVFNSFAALGASVNAYTSHTMTRYPFSTTDNFEAALDRLLDFVQAPHFTPEGVQKEIGIIEQEIRMYQDQPRHRLGMNLLEALYHAHPVRIDIAGTVESIRRIDPETLYACYDTFYHPSNMAVFVVGDVDPEVVLAQVEADVGPRGYAPR